MNVNYEDLGAWWTAFDGDIREFFLFKNAAKLEMFFIKTIACTTPPIKVFGIKGENVLFESSYDWLSKKTEVRLFTFDSNAG